MCPANSVGVGGGFSQSIVCEWYLLRRDNNNNTIIHVVEILLDCKTRNGPGKKCSNEVNVAPFAPKMLCPRGHLCQL